MPRSRRRTQNTGPSSGAGPACLFVGIFLGRSGRAAQAFVPSLRGFSLTAPPPLPTRGRACVRPRAEDMRLSATGGGGGAGDMDSSELYADMRRRLEELRQSSSDNISPSTEEDVSDLGLFQQQQDGGGSGFPTGGGGAGAKAYSAQEMKQRYYEAFWRARNLHKETKFEGSSGTQDDMSSSSDAAPPVTPPPEAQAAARTTILSPMALDMFHSRGAAAAADPAEAAVAPPGSDVQGLTQMYNLEEEESAHAASPAAALPAGAGGAGLGGINRQSALLRGKRELLTTEAAAVAASLPGRWQQQQQQQQQPHHAVEGVAAHASAAHPPAGVAGVGANAGGVLFATSSADGAAGEGAAAASLSAEPQGLTQVFFLDPEEEAEAVAALPVVPGRSFLREKLGVPGEVVQDLRQVELDHARLAMLAVLLSGAVGAGAGAGAGVYLNAHDGFSALADVARTPWLDPYVAGGILAAKALSEGDWRIGKGALAGWADQALSAVSNAGAKALRLGSGNEIRRLAVEMEVKHGRMALGAVVCAMAQQGILTTVAA